MNGLNVLKINTAPDYFVSKEGGMSYLSYDMDPVLTVPSGSVVRFETDDAWRGLLTGRETPYAAVKDQYPHTTADYNPVSGPVYIEEAKAGDIIRIEIQKIELADEGHMYQGADFLKLYHLAPEDIWPVLLHKGWKSLYGRHWLGSRIGPHGGLHFCGPYC